MEIWKDIKGYEGLYQVSNLGRVKSLHYRHSNREKILPLQKCREYLNVGLSKNGKQTPYFIHRLVAQTFIPNPDGLPEVNHKDENKYNNCIDNLEWISTIDNFNYGTRNKRISEKLINHPNKSKSVQCIETGIIYPSAHEAERQTGINFSKICAVCRGDRNKTGGYHWRYKDGEA